MQERNEEIKNYLDQIEQLTQHLRRCLESPERARVTPRRLTEEQRLELKYKSQL